MNRRTALTMLMIAALALAALAARGRMLQSHTRARAAQQTLDGCRLHAAAIADIRNRPAVAADGEDLGGEIQAAIETVAQAVGIATDKIVRISPLPPQRLADSAYKEKPTLVRLEATTPAPRVVAERTSVAAIDKVSPEARSMPVPDMETARTPPSATFTWSAPAE